MPIRPSPAGSRGRVLDPKRQLQSAVSPLLATMNAMQVEKVEPRYLLSGAYTMPSDTLTASAITASQASAIKSGLDGVVTWVTDSQAEGELATTLDFIKDAAGNEVSMASLLNPASVVQTNLAATVRSYFDVVDPSSPTTGELVTNLSAIAGVTGVRAGIATGIAGQELRIDITLSTVATVLGSFTSDLTGTSAGLSMGLVNKPVSGTTSLGVSFGLQLNSQLSNDEAFFTRNLALDTSLDLHATGISQTAKVGFVDASTASASINTDLDLRLNANDVEAGNGIGVTLSELNGYAIATTMNQSRLLDAISGSVPVSVTIGTYVGSGTVTLGGSTFAGVTTSNNAAYNELKQFNNVDQFSVLSGLQQLSGFFGALSDSSILGSAAPFAKNLTLGTGADLGTALDSKLVSLLGTNNTPSFTSAQTLSTLLQTVTGVNPSVGYDAAGNRITYTVDVPRHNFAAALTPLGLSYAGGFLKDLASSSQISITSRTDISFKFSLDVTNGLESITNRLRIADAVVDTRLTPSGSSLAGQISYGFTRLSFGTASVSGFANYTMSFGTSTGAREADESWSLFDAVDAVLLGNLGEEIVENGLPSFLIPDPLVLDSMFLLPPGTNVSAAIVDIVDGNGTTQSIGSAILEDLTGYSIEDVKDTVREANEAMAAKVFEAADSALEITGTQYDLLTGLPVSAVTDVMQEGLDQAISEFEESAQRAATVQDVGAILVDAVQNSVELGVQGLRDAAVSVVVDTINNTLDIDYDTGVDQDGNETPFYIDMQKFVTDAGGNGNLSTIDNFTASGEPILLDVGLISNMDVGLDLTDGSTIIYDTSEITYEYYTDTQNLDEDGSADGYGVDMSGGRVTNAQDTGAPNGNAPNTIRTKLPARAGGYTSTEAHNTNANHTRSGKFKLNFAMAPFGGAPLPNLTINISNTNAPAGNTTIPSTPNFTNLLAGFNLQNNVSGLIGGLDDIFSGLSTGLINQALNIQFPLIGDKLKEVADVFKDVRDRIVPVIAGAPNFLAATIKNQLQAALGTVVNMVTNAAQVSYSFTLTKTIVNVDKELETSLGLPALGAKLTGGFDTNVSYSIPITFGINLTDGVFLDTTTPVFTFDANATLNAGLTGTMGFLIVTAESADAELGVRFSVDIKDPGNNDGKLTQAELVDLLSGNIGGGNLANLLGVTVDDTLPGGINFDFTITADTTIDWLPGMAVDLEIDWPFNGTNINGSRPSVQFTDARIMVGSFLTRTLGPVIESLNTILEPVYPVLEILDTPIPLLETMGFEQATVLDLLSAFSSVADVGLIEAAVQVLDFANFLRTVQVGDEVVVHLSDLDFNRSEIDFSQALPYGFDFDDLALMADNINLNALGNFTAAAGATFNTYYNNSTTADSGSLKFPILENPLSAFELLLGLRDDVELVTYDLPELNIEAGFSTKIIPFPLFPPFNIEIFGGVGLHANIAVGLDTKGAVDYLRTGDEADLFNGFYVSDRENADGTGSDVNEFELTGEIKVYVGLDVIIAAAGAGGGLVATVGADLNDQNFDGKLRAGELHCLDELFGFNGNLAIEFEAFARLLTEKYEAPFARIELFSFEIPPGDCDVGAPQTGNLADIVNVGGVNTLMLNVGSRANLRDVQKNEINERINVRFDSGTNLYYVEGFGRSESFNPLVFTRIEADAGDGDDLIYIDPSVVGKTISLAGGAGNDALYAEGNASQSTLNGGTGNDYLAGGENNDSLVGGDGADTMHGNAGNDTISGDAGSDSLTGDAGADSILGGDNADTIYGGTENDTLLAGNANDVVFGDLGSDSIEGGSGDDQLLGGPDVDTSGASDNDTIKGQAGNDTIVGGKGNDSLLGGTNDDSLSAGEGNDTLDGEDGNDSMSAGIGNDILIDTLGDNYFDGSDGTDSITALGGADTIYGGIDNDTISAGNGNNEIYGEAGADSIIAGSGLDTIDAGQGNDSVNSGFGNDSVLAGDGRDTVYAGDGNDTVDGGADNDSLYGEIGNDSLLGKEGLDSIYGDVGLDTIFGGAHADLIYGGNDADSIRGNNGNDTINGEAGNDSIDGNSGDDLIYSQTGNDSVRAGSGKDIVYGDVGLDTLRGQEDADLLIGWEDDDSLTGNAGNDILYAGRGYDTASGGLGDDRIFGERGFDSLAGGDGNDYLEAGDGDDTLLGGEGDDCLLGQAGADSMRGDAGDDRLEAGGNGTILDARNNTLDGGTGDDSLVGSDIGGAAELGDYLLGGDGDDRIDALGGNDLIDAGTGNDRVFAGEGIDIVNGRTGNDSLLGEGGSDAIYGDEGDDTIDGGLGTDSLLGGNGNDVITAFTGQNETILGGGGDDLLIGSPDGADSILGGNGDDRVEGLAGNDTLVGEAGQDSVSGGDGDDTIEGGSGRDVLLGGNNHDKVYGHSSLGTGDDSAVDVLWGDLGDDNTALATAGRDVLNGNGGNDLMFGEGQSDSIVGIGGADVIDYGNGSVATEGYTAPAATANPPANPGTPASRVGNELATGIIDNAHWGALAGVDARNGISPTDGQDLTLVSHQGDLIAAWSAPYNGNFEIYIARFNRNTSAWEEYRSGSASSGGVTNSALSQTQPSLLSLAGGEVLLSYTETDASGNQSIQLKTSTNASTFTNVGGFLGSSTHAHSSKLIKHIDGFSIYWLDNSALLQRIARNRFADGTQIQPVGWTGSVMAFEPLQNIFSFDVDSNGTWNLALAYSYGTEPSRKVKYYIGLDTISPGTGVDVSTVGKDASDPSVSVELASDQEQWTSWVAWTEQDEKSSNVRAKRLRKNPNPGTTDFEEVQPQFYGDAAARTTAAGVSDTIEYASKPKLQSGGFNTYLWWQDDSIRSGDTLASLMHMVSGTGPTMVERIGGDASDDGIGTTPGAFQNVDAFVGSDKVVTWNDASNGHGSTRALRDANFLYFNADVTAANANNIQTLLDGPTIATGVVLIEPGTYNGFTIASTDSGLTLKPKVAGTVIINGNVTINAANTRIEGLTINGSVIVGAAGTSLRGNTINSGALDGVDLTASATGMTIADNTITSSAKGIDLAFASDGEITRNKIVAGTRGIDIQAAFTGDIEQNDIVGTTFGVRWNASARLFDNDIHDSGTGIQVLTGNASNGLGALGPSRANRIYDNSTGVALSGGAFAQRQHIYGNSIGVSGTGTLGGSSTGAANLIEDNDTGVSMNNGTVRFNVIRDNTIGIIAAANLTVSNNILIDNITTDIRSNNATGVVILSNTIDSAANKSIEVITGAAANIRGNIINNTAGIPLAFGNAAAVTTSVSDYNTLHTDGPTVASVGAALFTSLLGWQNNTSKDAHSVGPTANNRGWSRPHFGVAYSLPTTVAGDRSSSVGILNNDPSLNTNVPFNQGTYTLTGFDTAVTTPMIFLDTQLDAFDLTVGPTVNIRWRTLNFTGGTVKIDLYQSTASGPVFVQTLAAAATNNGTYNYVSTLNLTGAMIHISKTGDAAVFARSLPDTSGPVLGFAGLATKDRTPALTGTINDNTATVIVNVLGIDYSATNNANGTWTLVDNTLPSLADGVYDVEVRSTDAAGNVTVMAFDASLSVDATAPIVGFADLQSTDASPALSGSIDDSTASVIVRINGVNYPAAVSGSTWTIADNAIALLADGQYDVRIIATDVFANTTDITYPKALTIDATAPAINFTPVLTNDATPDLFFLVNDASATITFTINGTVYTPTRVVGTLYRVAGTDLVTSLPSGVYAVSIQAIDLLGNTTTLNVPAGVTVDTVAPSALVTSQLTKDNTPAISGTVNDPAAAVQLTINGLSYAATNNGNGTWTLADNLVATLPDGSYSVTVRTTDPAGNRNDQVFADAITVDATAPTTTLKTFAFEWYQEVQIDFSEILVGFAGTDATIRNTATNAIVPGASYTFSGSNHAGRWRFNSILANGNYRLTIPAGAATDAAGNPFASAVTLDFFVLAGDANRDGIVNFDDLLRLAQSYGKANKSFSQGNFNYDAGGNVNFDDLLALAQNYGSTVLRSTPTTGTSTTKSKRGIAAAELVQ